MGRPRLEIASDFASRIRAAKLDAPVKRDCPSSLRIPGRHDSRNHPRRLSALPEILSARKEARPQWLSHNHSGSEYLPVSLQFRAGDRYWLAFGSREDNGPYAERRGRARIAELEQNAARRSPPLWRDDQHSTCE